MSDEGEASSDPRVDAVTDQVLALLSPLGSVTAQRLFSTYGLYLRDRIFGLVHDGIVYLRTGTETAARYVEAGSQPFLYRRSDGRSTVLQYHEVPDDVMADPHRLVEWAREALETPR